jgi:tripartite-type tricarboxylate transporter receptor subunit TctC
MAKKYLVFLAAILMLFTAPAFADPIEDFYRGKSIRIVVGFGPGGATDTISRLLQRALSKHIPGNPSVVVENKPGGGSMLALNTVYNSEPKDGTVIVGFNQDLIRSQALGAPGVRFDARQLNWIATTDDTVGICAARTDSGISKIQDIMGGKQLVVSSFGKGTLSYDPPAVMKAVLGTNFKIVTGYQSGAAQRLAVKSGEAQGFCTSLDPMTASARELLEGSKPITRIIIVTGSQTPDSPFTRGVPAAETLAKTDEAKRLLRAIHLGFTITIPYAFAPGVPKERVKAMQTAFAKTFKDPEFLALAEKAQQTIRPKIGDEVGRIANEMLDLPPALAEKLKVILQ